MSQYTEYRKYHKNTTDMNATNEQQGTLPKEPDRGSGQIARIAQDLALDPAKAERARIIEAIREDDDNAMRSRLIAVLDIMGVQTWLSEFIDHLFLVVRHHGVAKTAGDPQEIRDLMESKILEFTESIELARDMLRLFPNLVKPAEPTQTGESNA